MVRFFLSSFMLAGVLASVYWAQEPAAGKNAPFIRGQKQGMYLYRAPDHSGRINGKILFAPGDGGWRGFAVTIAETMASWGYDVFGVDTKQYLESFTGRAPLRETDVMSDLKLMAKWITRGQNERIILVGWSEGAGLCLLGAAGSENAKVFSGLITIGLSESHVLGWRWTDDLTYITKTDPNEPKFMSAGFMSRVAPLPLVMIQASRDEYIPVEAARHLFALAGDPKQFRLIEAQNHRFDGNRREFFTSLRDGLEWISQRTK